MIRYRSKHSELPVKFSLGRTDYSVEPGEVVSIDSKWKPWIEARGLLLEEVADEVAEPTPEPTTVEPEAPVTAPRRGRPRNS